MELTIGRKYIWLSPAELGIGAFLTLFGVGVLFAIFILPLTSLASPLRVPAPSLSLFPDTEAVTNVAFDTGAEDGRISRLSIQLNATASNNVVVAFGHDADGNGVLDRAEADLLVGWDAGRWFCRDRVSGFSRAVVREDCPRQLDWKLILNARKEAETLTTSDDFGVVFDESVPSTMFSSGWNMMRVSARGLGGPGGLVVTDVAGWGLRVIAR